MFGTSDWVEVVNTIPIDSVGGGFRSGGFDNGEDKTLEEVRGSDVRTLGGSVLGGFGTLEKSDGDGAVDVDEDSGVEVGGGL